ncbi:MAG TPA: tripartite tricarboxylate transporter substrate binding protein [Xanthobacteraceae bacterium]|nr:tripartite tricarboxylate transporter substrate binding protein [Xanthobacteraceae bacterium]
MRVRRREFLFLATTAAVAAAPIAVRAQAYPARPLHIVSPAPAGGATDILARLMGEWLAERLGQGVIVDNRPGAGTNLGTEAVAHAAADGYTLLVIAPTAAVNATLYEKLSFDFLRDIAPVAGIMRVPQVMEVGPSVPASTVPEFIAYARENRGAINMASAGIGTSPHMAGELFKIMTGIEMTHVPYRGSAPALTDLIGGRVQVMFDALLSSIAQIRAGRLRALAVTTAQRAAALPEVPTVADFVPGYEASAWYALGAPKATPDEIVARLNREINAGLADTRIRQRFAELGGAPMPMTPAELGGFITAETEKWAKVVHAAHLKAE